MAFVQVILSKAHDLRLERHLSPFNSQRRIQQRSLGQCAFAPLRRLLDQHFDSSRRFLLAPYSVSSNEGVFTCRAFHRQVRVSAPVTPEHSASSNGASRSSLQNLRVLFVSSPVGPLGTGQAGGVELTLGNLARELLSRGIDVQVVAPEGSSLDGVSDVVQIAGSPQLYAQHQSREDPVTMPADAVLGNMWDYVRAKQGEYDLALNFAFDWLPLYVSPFLHIPVAHLISMGSLNDSMDTAIQRVANFAPQTVAVHTHAQANTFPPGVRSGLRALGNGFDLSKYPFSEEGKNGSLVWVGRIAPEKGLEDAVAAAAMCKRKLLILGHMQDREYYDNVLAEHPSADVEYLGFVNTEELADVLGQKSRALLVTPKWEEAFGNVAVEALACGCPVIAYRRGGPQEIVEDGVSGFLVEADNVEGLVSAIHSLDKIKRVDCRQRAEAEYSQQKMGDRVLHWFHDILDHAGENSDSSLQASSVCV